MNTHSRRSWWTGFALGGLAMLVAGVLWSAAPRPAYAQVPDSGAQRFEMIRELQASNRKLAEIADLLRQIRDQRNPPEPAPKK
jgi:hypothetical protein